MLDEAPLQTPPASPQQIQSGIKDIARRVRGWWKYRGLGYTSELHLTESGHVEAQLSFTGYSMFDMLEDDDGSLSEQQYSDRLKSRFEKCGFVVHSAPGEDLAVVDCDASQQALRKLVLETFPSSVVRSVDVRCIQRGIFVLQSTQVLIRDLSEVLALPAPPEDFVI